MIRGKECIPWLFSILVLFSSCEDTYGIEAVLGTETTISIHVGQAAFSPNDQGVLLEQLQKRLQVSNVSDSDGVCTVSFHGSTSAHILKEYFPFITTTDETVWVINGQKTHIPIRKDENDRLIPPTLDTGETGFWFLDNEEVSVPTDSYLAFHADNASVHLLGLLKYNDKLYVYKSDGTLSGHDIIYDDFYQVPNYWFDHLVEKEMLAEEAVAEADGDCSAFVYFTDAHWGNNTKKSPALIRHIHDFTPFTDVIFGGDLITVNCPSIEAALQFGLEFQSSFSYLGTDFHCVYGNHDDNSAGQPGHKELILSEEQVYSFLQSQMTDVVYGNYYNFYYDKPESKTRIICLDTGRYNNASFRGKLPDTVRFAVESLSTVPEGWHVIVVSHIWCASKKESDGTYSQYVDGYIKPILKVFDDYNSRSPGGYAYKQWMVSYDFTDASGKIEFCIGGHTHGNFTTYSEGGIPVIIVTSDCILPSSKKGTITEQSLTLVVADYKNRKLSLTVVGRTSDRIVNL